MKTPTVEKSKLKSHCEKAFATLTEGQIQSSATYRIFARALQRAQKERVAA